MIDFGKVREMSIPEGMVAQIMSGGVLLWKKPSAGARFVGYTGTYTESSAEIDGAAYTLYTLTTSGTLTVEGEGIMFWMCGGGGGGQKGVSGYSGYSGMGGGGGYISQGELASGEYAVVIGAGGKSNGNGGQTQIGEMTADGGKKDGSGSSGGGGGSTLEYANEITLNNGGTGQGVGCVPFGLSSLDAHCAGGGGGGALNNRHTSDKRNAKGGAGGSNGANGEKGRKSHTISETNSAGGAGGIKGGGQGGGGVAASKGSAATFYGSGGGGGSAYMTENALTAAYAGGSGYQGVVYIAIPA